MGLSTKESVALAVAGANAVLSGVYDKLRDALPWGDFAAVEQTTLPTVKYPNLGAFPAMREWTGERRPNAARVWDYSISDRKWETSVEIERTALEDDQTGVLQRRINTLSRITATNRYKQATLILATNPNSYDGVALFATTHPESGTNQSNKTTSALSEAEVATGMVTMGQITDDQGEPLGISPNVLMVGPKNQLVAKRIVESTLVVAIGVGASAATTGNGNVLQGMLRVHVNPYLVGAYDDYWYLIDSRTEQKPVIVQERSDLQPEIDALIDPNSSDKVFNADVFTFGSRVREGFGAGNWQCAYAGIV